MIVNFKKTRIAMLVFSQPIGLLSFSYQYGNGQLNLRISRALSIIPMIKSNSLIYFKSISGFVCPMSNLRYKKFLKFCQPMTGQPLSITFSGRHCVEAHGSSAN